MIAQGQIASSRSQLELSSRVPRSARPGDLVACEWELRNCGVTEIVVSFYLATRQVTLAVLACPSGRARRGRFVGSAALVIETGEVATISALLEPRVPGSYPVRVALVTRDETIERCDTVVVGRPEAAGM